MGVSPMHSTCACEGDGRDAHTTLITPPIRTGKSLDQKLASIRANPSRSTDFILADAKDADMATGLAATGVDPPTGKRRSLNEYRDHMREIVRQGLVDIMLMSCSTSEQLTIRERLFENSTVTPAVRANDTTDIHLPAGGTYSAEPSRPFRSTTIQQIQSGKVNPTPDERRLGADLGLYSITPNNHLEFDYATLHAYRDFRIEAEANGFRHFLEVFDPNACADKCPADLGRFINDLIVRTLAGVPSRGRPVFLKIAYHGPRAMEELVAYDPTLIVGILGGSAGTTHDAFKLLEDAKRHGARAALFGRKINNAEHQLTFVQFLHAIANGQIGAEEATRAYHGELERLKLKPHRPLKDDLQITDQAMSYAGSTKPTTAATAARPRVTMSTGGAAGVARTARPTTAPPVVATAVVPKPSNGNADFSKMSSAEKVAYARRRIKDDIARGNSDGDTRRRR
jgi:hypothetical protein